MAGFRSVSYKITGTTENEIVGLIAKVLDPTYPDMDMELGLKTDFSRDKWRGYSDGYWRGFIRNDSCGITLQLTYHFPATRNSSSIADCHLLISELTCRLGKNFDFIPGRAHIIFNVMESASQMK